MEFTDVLALRQSTRSYTEEKVAKEDIEKILAAAQRAPVGMHNYKGYLLSVITAGDVLDAMKTAYTKASGKTNDPSYGAPLFILVSKTKDALDELVKYDAACIIENMHLAAAELGLGSVYIHGMIFAIRGEKEWQKAAGLSDDAVPICGISVGHSKMKLRPRPAKNVLAVSWAE